MPEITNAPLRSIAGIASFRDRDRLLAALKAEFNAPIPTKPGFIQAGPATIACLAPTRFLASSTANANLAGRLAEAFRGLAAVTDQSELWTTWLVSGQNVRELLARVVPIDIAPAIFQIGDLALTRAGHLDVRLCRTGAEAYEIAVTRSVAADLVYALQSAARGL